MSCKFCPLGCPINNKYDCCYECDEQEHCEDKCSGMPESYKQCAYYEEQ